MSGWSGRSASQTIKCQACGKRPCLVHATHETISCPIVRSCVYIYIGSRLGVPRSFQEPSVLSLYYKRRYGIASLRPIYIYYFTHVLNGSQSESVVTKWPPRQAQRSSKSWSSWSSPKRDDHVKNKKSIGRKYGHG